MQHQLGIPTPSPSRVATGLSPQNRPTPFVFVVGCPRSGTTLLQRMLDNHPCLAVANDTHFIPKGLKGTCIRTDPRLTETMVEHVKTYRRFSRLGLAEEAIDDAARTSASYGTFVGKLYSEFARQHGKPLGGEKTPDYVKCLPLLHTLFPDAKFIHIIRDGRDVALSTVEWAHESKGPGRFALWREHPVAVCALWWSRQVGVGRRDGAKLGTRLYHEVRYEDLVADPESTLSDTARFLELPYDAAMGAYHVGKTRTDAGLSTKNAWLPPVAGLRDWRTCMAPDHIEMFNALAGPMLVELGYCEEMPTQRPEVLQLAELLRTRWWAEVVKRAS